MIRKHRKKIALVLAIIQVILIIFFLKWRGRDFISFSVTDGSLIGALGLFLPAILAIVVLATGASGEMEEDIRKAEEAKAATAPPPPPTPRNTDYMEGIYGDDSPYDEEWKK